MNGVAGSLNFALGISVEKFASSLGVASGKLIGFLGIATGIQAAFAKMWGTIDQGGKLTDLAAAAGVAVKDLVQLREAFEQVGASAESVPAIINRFRRTLAGGEQNGLLKQLGLDPASLGGMNPAAQFEAVAAALAKVDANSRAAAAQNLFGREGAQTIQQIANSGNDFADAMKAAADNAATWQMVSKTFDAIGDKVKEVQNSLSATWALLTGAMIQAFQEGKLTELITDIFITAFQVAFQALPSIALGALVKVGEILLRIVEVLNNGLQTVLEWAIQKLTEFAAKIPLVRDALGVPEGFTADTFEQLWNQNKGNKLNIFGASTDDIGEFANRLIKDGVNKSGDILAGLSDRLKEFAGRLPQAAGKSGSTSTAGLDFGKEKSLKTDFTDVERMGFVFAGLGRGFGGDDNRRTADNTKKTADLLVTTNKILADIRPALSALGINV